MISEKQFTQQIKELCKMFGWLYYHTHRSQFSPAGFPDVVAVLAVDKRVVYVELKSEKGKLSHDQRLWLWHLAAAGQEVYVWRPDDLQQAAKVLR